MEQMGFTTPHEVVNEFGLDAKTIAQSFIFLGPSHALVESNYLSTQYLVMFARKYILNGHFSKPTGYKTWKSLKTSNDFDTAFENFNMTDLGDLKDFLENPIFFRQAKKEMRLIRNIVKSWLKQGQCNNVIPNSVPGYNSDMESETENAYPTPIGPSPTTPIPVSSQWKPTSISPSMLQTPTHNLQDLSGVSNSTEKLAKEIDKILQEIKDLGTTVSQVKSTVKQEVDNAVNAKMGNSINERAKQEVKRHIRFLAKPQEIPKSQAGAPDDDPNESESSEESEDESKGKDTKEQENDDFKFLQELVNLPMI